MIVPQLISMFNLVKNPSSMSKRNGAAEGDGSSHSSWIEVGTKAIEFD